MRERKHINSFPLTSSSVYVSIFSSMPIHSISLRGSTQHTDDGMKEKVIKSPLVPLGLCLA